MNFINGYAFDSLKRADETYRAATADALSAYRTDMNKVRETAKKYKDENEYINSRQPQLAETTRAALQSARNTFVTEVKSTARTMRESLGKYLSEPLNTDFQNKLKLYSDFGVPMCKSEVNAMLSLNKGNPFGLRALATVLERTKADWRLSYRDVGQYEKDLEELDKYVVNPPVYIPGEYHSEGCELYRKVRIKRTASDGKSVYESGSTYDSVAIIIDTNIHESMAEKAQGMRQSWTADINTPAISKASKEEVKRLEEENKYLKKEGVLDKYLNVIPDEEESTTRIEESNDKGLQLARDLGLRDAKAEEAYRTGMEVWKK